MSARIRPMRAEDSAAVERLSAAAYDEDRPPDRAAQWRERTEHLVGTDPGGCWVAEVDDDLIGFAVATRRELMWLLASFAVRGDARGHGVGKALLAVANDYGKGCLRAMLNSSEDQRALRSYHALGFALAPLLSVRGVPDRSAIPVVSHVREGSAGDRDLMDSVDRQTRGAAHGPDHELLVGHYRLVVVDRPSGSGYAYVRADGVLMLLAATSRRTATDLLWEVVGSTPPGSPVAFHHLSAANPWALDVAFAARLEVSARGFQALRGMRSPAPYVPHGSLM